MKNWITLGAAGKRLRRVSMICIWILIWHLLSLAIHSDIFLPSPVSVVRAFFSLVKTASFWLAIGHSLMKICIGFLLGVVSAIGLGGIACRYRWVREFLAPMISTIKSIPVASFIILALVWINSKQLSVFISFLVTFPILYISVLEGYDHVDVNLLEMTKVFRVKGWMKIRYVYVSEMIPFLTAGAKTAVGMCWKAGISGEIIGLPKNSIGEQLYLSKLYLNISELFVWTFIIVLVCFLTEKLFFALLKRLEKRILS